ncbi:MAG: hypothetical protein IT289_00940 [Oligoflexia bacterium]|nr:hypothetical protein [Oligoflexia bacterium]
MNEENNSSGTPPPDSSQGSENQNPSESNGPTRILAISNNRRSIENSLIFLQRRGYQVATSNQIIEALKKIQKIKPHVVLISWNLKKTNVRKAYKLLHDSFDCVVIAFAEDTSTKTSASLMGSGIPNTLLAPITGPGIHMRVQALLRKKEQERASKDRLTRSQRRQEFLKSQADALNKDLQPGDIPPETSWERVEGNSDSPDQAVWKGVSTSPDGKKSVFYFKGPNAPSYDSQSKRWAGMENSGQLYSEHSWKKQVDHGVSENHNIASNTQPQLHEDFSGDAVIQETFDSEKEQALLEKEFADIESNIMSDFEEDFEDTAPGAEASSDTAEIADLAEQLKVEAISDELTPTPTPTDSGTEQTSKPTAAAAKSASPFQENSPEPAVSPSRPIEEPDSLPEPVAQIHRGKTSILMQAVKDSLAYAAHPSGKKQKPLKEFVMAVAGTVETFRFKGYLAICTSDAKPNLSFCEKFWETLEKQMKDREEPLKPTVLRTLTFSSIKFSEWALREADFHVWVEHQGFVYAITYLALDQIPQLKENKRGDIFGVDLAKDVVANSTLNFDLHIYLPKNNKFIRYVRKGAELTEKTYLKLLKYGIEYVYIKAEDRENFFTYCLLHRIVHAEIQTSPSKVA